MKTSTYDEICDDEEPACEQSDASCPTDPDPFESCTDVSLDAAVPLRFAARQETLECPNPIDAIVFSDESDFLRVEPGFGPDVDVSAASCASEPTSPGDSFRPIEAGRPERRSPSPVSLPADLPASEAATAEPASEMYYTASSEVSLLSDTEIPQPERAADEEGRESKAERRECAVAGHVAAMRERFESMTRTNTPCPDLVRSSSPSYDVFRNVTPSPDRLG